MAGSPGPSGPSGPAGPSGSPGPTGLSAYELWLADGHTGTVTDFLEWLRGITDYGSFYDTTIQTNALGANAMRYDTTAEAIGISVGGTDDSQVTVTNDGVYNIQFSAVFLHDGGARADVEVWFRIDGTDVPWSNTDFTVDKATPFVAAWNFVTSLSAGDYVQIMWYSPETTMVIEALPAGVRPAIPSVILTIDQIL